MVLTRSPELFENLKLYRTHGVTRDDKLLGKTDPDPWYYEQVTFRVQLSYVGHSSGPWF